MDEANQQDNSELAERNEYCAESPDIVLISSRHVDVFYIDKLIPAGIDVFIKLYRTKTSFLIGFAMGTS